MELVRTRLAVSSQGQYKGMADCIRNVLKYEGVRAFYRGLTPSLVICELLRLHGPYLPCVLHWPKAGSSCGIVWLVCMGQS